MIMVSPLTTNKMREHGREGHREGGKDTERKREKDFNCNVKCYSF